jgi:tRNA splicing endonuclease
MICKRLQNKYLIVKIWKFSSFKESRKKLFPHGIFINDFIWLECKSSFIYLWLKSGRTIGKGIFSRSEPLFVSPNPCYNSLGKAGRKRASSKKNLSYCVILEDLQVNLFEFLYHSNKINIFTQFESSLNTLKTVTIKLDLDFFFIFFHFRNLITKLLDLKSGIKFSGNFLIYRKKKKTFNFHNHSKGLVTNENLSFQKTVCVFCQNFGIQFLDIQNRTRLCAQVSKFNVFCIGTFYLKTFFFKKIEDFIKNEVNVTRYIIK